MGLGVFVILYNSLKNIGNNFEYYIHEDFRRQLNKRIYTCFIDSDFLLLKLCEKDNNGIEHVINECEKLKKERNQLIVELNKLDNKIKNKTLLESSEYFNIVKNYLQRRMITKELN